MLICSLMDKCIERCRNGLVRPDSTSNTAASAASTSAKSRWYSGCSAIQSAATVSRGVIPPPSRLFRNASQKNRLTSSWDGANIAELSPPSDLPTPAEDPHPMNVTTEQLFTEARTHNGFAPEPIPESKLLAIYELAKWGPTSANCSPMRII